MITFDKVSLCHLAHCGLFDSFPDDVGRIIHTFIPHRTGYHQSCSVTGHPELGSSKPQPSHCLWSSASGIGQDLEEMVHLCSHGVSWVAQFSSTWPLSCPGTLTIQGSSLSFQHGSWLQRGGKLGSLLMSGLRGNVTPSVSSCWSIKSLNSLNSGKGNWFHLLMGGAAHRHGMVSCLHPSAVVPILQTIYHSALLQFCNTYYNYLLCMPFFSACICVPFSMIAPWRVYPCSLRAPHTDWYA